MVEVFKTNVSDRITANLLIDQIHQSFNDYHANFDLEDCDKILRVECLTGTVQSSILIDLLKDFGFNAEILPDEIYPINEALLHNEKGNRVKVSLDQ